MSLKDKLPGALGFGTAPLGNMFRAIPEEEAQATVHAAWDAGVRYFDTAPFYGSGLSEIRLGEALKQYNRDDYVLSSKVGRVILDEVEDAAARDLGEKSGVFEHGRPNKIVNDYSADATLRSIEDSLKRLQTDRLDIVWVHDIAQDFYGDQWLEYFNQARTGAFKVLTRLREEGVIKGWGLGVNKVEPCELTLDLTEAQPDGFLLAGRYTLLDHERAVATSDGLGPGAERRNRRRWSLQLGHSGRWRALRIPEGQPGKSSPKSSRSNASPPLTTVSISKPLRCSSRWPIRRWRR